MKNLYLLLTLFVISISLSSCDKCDGEQPRARIINNGTKEASVQIKTTGGNTENLNNVPAGTTSDFRNYAAGAITFTISVDKAVREETVQMSECYEYDITVDTNNNIITTPRDRND